MPDISLLICDKYKLGYVVIPKCGSRTIYQLMFDLAEIPDAGEKPWEGYVKGRGQEFARRGLTKHILIANDAIDFIEAHREITWFTIVRSPYDRILATYLKKINKVAKHLQPRTYYFAKFRTLFSHPKNWKGTAYSRRVMRNEISFERFLKLVTSAGLDFDTHFPTQKSYLMDGRVSLDFVIDLSDLHGGLSDMFTYAKVPTKGRDKMVRIRKNNASSPEKPKSAYMTQNAKTMIAEIYREDFEFLKISP